MTKVIENIELLEKLQPYLWETEKSISVSLWTVNLKTLTLEEAMDLLPIYTRIRQIRGWEWLTDNKALWIKDKNIWGKTKLQAIEKMLEYLIDNNLLKDE